MLLTRIAREGLAAGGYLLETALRLLVEPTRTIAAAAAAERPKGAAGSIGHGSTRRPRSGQRSSSVHFALDGQAYEIDLDPADAARLHATIQPYIDAGRQAKAGSPPDTVNRRPTKTKPIQNRGETVEIRAWARAHGHQISDRGRIPARVIDAYRAVNRV